MLNKAAGFLDFIFFLLNLKKKKREDHTTAVGAKAGANFNLIQSGGIQVQLFFSAHYQPPFKVSSSKEIILFLSYRI